MKIVTILGARPQFIKAGSVSREILRQRRAGADIQEVIVHTGQHYDANMSDVFFEEMQIPKPDYFLGISGKTHGAMTGQMIDKIEEILDKEKPDWVMVYGDTNSTLAGAIAASKLHIKIAHVESGLRSFNMQMPEEINRILTDRISSVLFCPTQTAVDNLNNEGIGNWRTDAKVSLSGDVMQDGANFYKDLSQQPEGLDVTKDFVLCTIHRAENTDNPERLAAIVAALNEINATLAPVVLPLHPRTLKLIAQHGLELNVNLIDPLGYFEMLWLLDHCELVLTDSGGIQKEAFFFGKACVTMRDQTEWVELIEVGANELVDADTGKIIAAVTRNMGRNVQDTRHLYGGGNAAEKIVNELIG